MSVRAWGVGRHLGFALVLALFVSWILGAHIEMTRTAGRDIPRGSGSHPNEHRLELPHSALLLLQQTIRGLGAVPQRVVREDFIVNPLN